MITKQSTTLGALLYGTDCMTVFSNLYVFSPYTDCIQHDIYVYGNAVKYMLLGLGRQMMG